MNGTEYTQENRSKNTPIHIWSIDFLQKPQGNLIETGRSFKQMVHYVNTSLDMDHRP